MDAHLIDSRIFGHQWSTSEARALFSERQRVQRWLDVIAALARAQASVGLIPAEAASAISKLKATELSLDDIAARTRQTSHSTLGLIQVLRERLPDSAAHYVYYGATVQDVTDTSAVLELRTVGAILWREWNAIEDELLQLAWDHRATPMSGRTHGQPGAPISFGFKAASWADELGRSLERLAQGRERWLVGQLGGAVGTVAFFGTKGIDLRSAFCKELGLATPAMSWLSCRDRLAEFAQVLSLGVSALARMANEVYALQRREIGELAERVRDTTVGSITMPHKRNPEVSEQIVVLARIVRSQSTLLTESLVHEHERDARGWKVEWLAFPELCSLALTATSMALELVQGLEVRTDRMRANLDETASSELLLSEMSVRMGKHQAQATLQEAFRLSREQGSSLRQALEGVATPEELVALDHINLGTCEHAIESVREVAKQRRMQWISKW